MSRSYGLAPRMTLARPRKAPRLTAPRKSSGPRTAPGRMRHDERQEESEEEEDEEVAEEEEEQPRSSRRSGRGSGAAAAAAPARGSSAAGAAAAAAGARAAPRVVAAGVPLCQALLRFFTVNGRATRAQVARVFDEVRDRCTDADSRTLTLSDVYTALNEQIRFMELEIKKHRSEIDDEEWWCLVDNTERAPVARAVHNDAEGEGEVGAAAAAAASPAAGGSKALDANAMTKLLNPSMFSEGEIKYFRALLDTLLASSTGKLSWASAIGCRKSITADGLSQAALKKLRLDDDAASHAMRRLIAQGWVRVLPASLALLEASLSNNERFVCLGERSYAELRKYVDSKTDGRQCDICHSSCVLGVTCQQQSSESKAAQTCPVRMHYSCARSLFEEQGKDSCPDANCRCRWDKYIEASRTAKVKLEAAAAAAARPAAAAAAAPARGSGVKRRIAAVEDM